MINYLKSESFRLRKTRSTYLIGLLILLIPLPPLIMSYYYGTIDDSFLYNNTAFFFRFTRLSLVSIPFFIPFIANTLFANVQRYGVLKNDVAYGISRRTIYFSKFLMTALFSFAIGVLVLIIFTGTSLLLLTRNGQVEGPNFAKAVFAATPLLLAALAVNHMMVFACTKIENSYLGYYLIVIIIPILLGYLAQVMPAIDKISGLFLYIRLSENYWQQPQDILINWLYFIGYFVLFSFIGIKQFNQQEI
ncbi:ABC transporter permease [Vagococcus sp. BWB3-3]|uniref:ABC transporter permease n=1 Tax=Vagococcus allomyrinae TaxID=2794353 RepID=A0A940SWR0_9ENTE|nr:ABC transporter permease [Vagococcus allomyrinae]MBP1043545.1 ABC transporter permease [Vagococcus allomyrinae]